MIPCNNCSRTKTTPILTDSKIKHLISEELNYHIDNSIPLFKSFNILNRRECISLIKEARKLYSRNILNLNEIDTSLITSDIGNKGNYKGEKVPLDNPTPTENPTDFIKMDVPLFIRMLEYAREDAKTDMDLHNVAEKTISLSKTGEILTMNNYEDIVGKEITESYTMYHRNPNNKSVNKYTFNIYEQKVDISRIRKMINEILTK